MKFLLFIFLTAVFSIHASQVRFARQTLPRVNQIRIDDISITVDRDENCSTLWVLNAVCGAESRKIQMTHNGTDYLFFPGKILAVSNWNLPQGERWNCMQETLGELEIKEIQPSEIACAEEPYAKTKNGRLVISNGNIILECLPEINGIIPVFRDSVSRCNLFLDTVADGKNATLKSFDKVGFIDLLGGYGKVAEANMKWSFCNGTVNMNGKCGTANGITLERKVCLLPGSFVVEITSQARRNTPGAVMPEIRHRPMFRLPGKFKSPSLNIMTPQKGRLVSADVVAGTSCVVEGSSFAFSDINTGVMVGVEYTGARQIYLWVDKSFFTVEAQGTRNASDLTPPLKVRYFLLHGLNRADFIGKATVICLAEQNMTVAEKKDLTVEMAIASAVPLKNSELDICLVAKNGDVLKKMGLKPTMSAPGFASKMKIVLPTSQVPPGEILVKLELKDEKEVIITGSFPVSIFSAEEMKNEKAYLHEIDQRIQKLRTAYHDSPDKRSVMREFRRLTLLKKAYAEALQKGRFDEMHRLRKDNPLERSR